MTGRIIDTGLVLVGAWTVVAALLRVLRIIALPWPWVVSPLLAMLGILILVVFGLGMASVFSREA